jgi:poly(beta-D-mannuronate) lyase
VDGDVATRWSAETFPQSLEVDLGSVRRVGRTEVVSFQDRAYRFVVEVKASAAGSYLRVVDRTQNTTPGTPASPITDTFPAVDARFVRITVTGASGYTGTWASLTELRVFGAP